MSPFGRSVVFGGLDSARGGRKGQDLQDLQDGKRCRFVVRARASRESVSHKRRRGHGLYCTVALAIVALGHAPAARGECEYEWRPGQEIAGVDGTIYASMTWDPDGPGPLSEELVIGGEFSIAGNARASGIAAWDGSSWHAFGNGLGRVYALAVYDGDLIAAGYFWFSATPALYNIARWDGLAWQPLGGGIGGLYVYALTVFDGKLVAGGWFSSASGVAARNIAQWDGNNWMPLGSGIDYPPSSGAPQIARVYSLAAYQNKLIAGGEFTLAGGGTVKNIAEWDGTEWRSFGAMSNRVRAFTEFNGRLIAAGSYIGHNGAHSNYVSQWLGSSWAAIGDGMNRSVFALTVFDGKLLAGGEFTSADGTSSSYMAEWDGVAWSALDGGTDAPVQALAVYGDELIAGGEFSFAGSSACYRIARWNRATWQPLEANSSGFNRELQALTVYDGRLIAGGLFTSAGSSRAKFIAQWSGETWQPIGEGLNSYSRALAVHDGRLIAGGDFTVAGTTGASYIAQWDGKAWEPLASGMRGPPYGGRNGDYGYYPASVICLATHNEHLVAGGSFAFAGGEEANNIAEWDGISWQALGSGVDGYYEEFGGTYVAGLIVYDGKLIVGGNFTSAGGIETGGIAQWDGSTWQSLDGGTNGPAAGMVVYEGLLVVGGAFDRAGKESVSGIATWDGTTWSVLDFATNVTLVGLALVDGELIGWGYFPTGAGPYINQIARWDGVAWQPLGLGIDGPYAYASASCLFDGDLVLGGSFTIAGGNPSARWARWGPSCLKGDMNCDGVVDTVDVMPFVDAVLVPEEESDCVRYLANVSGDVEADGASKVDGADVGEFVKRIMNGE